MFCHVPKIELDESKMSSIDEKVAEPEKKIEDN